MIRHRDETPKRSRAKKPASFGLLASGTVGTWNIDLDEALDDKEEWFLDIDGPSTYLTFSIAGPDVVAAAVQYLQHPHAEPFHLGRFGTASVSLMWDNEGTARCFLVVLNPKARSTMRLTIAGDDLGAFRDALAQVADSLDD